MHGTVDFRFREDEVEKLKILLGDFGVLERPQQPSDLLVRLRAAGMVEEKPLMEESDLMTYWLTPEAKAAIRKALG